MSIVRALTLLTLDIVAVTALGLWLRSEGSPLGEGLLWGVVGGAITALSAIGGAWWAEFRRLKANQALAILVVGMLGRMAFLVVWAVLAVKLGEVDVLAFVAGFGAVFLLGQILEVWMLTRLGSRHST